MRRTAWTSRPARRGRRGGAGGHPGRRVHPGAGAGAAGRGPQPGGVVSDHPPPAGITLRDVRSGAHRHELVPRVSRVSGRAGVGIRVRVIAAHRDARRRPPTPFGRSPLSRHVAAGRRESQSQAVAHGAVPRGGVRDGVLPLWVLLAGAGLLWGALPRDRATGTTAARDHAASAEPGRPARSPGPSTGLPCAPSPARDGCTFH